LPLLLLAEEHLFAGDFQYFTIRIQFGFTGISATVRGIENLAVLVDLQVVAKHGLKSV
jgi:hypothetical protein